MDAAAGRRDATSIRRAGRAMDRTPRSIADYDALMDPIRAAREVKDGKQPVDPAKAAQAPLALVVAQRAPLRLVVDGQWVCFS